VLSEVWVERNLDVSYPEPSFAILGNYLILVGHPVSIPLPQRGRVVDTHGINRFNFKSCTFKLVDEETKRGRSISAGENILVHEKTPNQILVLPAFSQTSDLKEEDTIIIKHVINLAEECREVSDADMLGHFKTGDLVVAALRDGNIAVVHAQNSALFFGDTSLSQAVVSPGSLVAAKRNTSDASTVVGASIFSKRTPATADIEHPLSGLQLNFLADDAEFIILDLLKRLLAVDVGDDARCIDHARPKKPAVEVVATVIVVANLFFVCIICKPLAIANYV
jgi:hypothetical protein